VLIVPGIIWPFSSRKSIQAYYIDNILSIVVTHWARGPWRHEGSRSMPRNDHSSLPASYSSPYQAFPWWKSGELGKVCGIPSILCSLQMDLGHKVITILLWVTLLILFTKLGKATNIWILSLCLSLSIRME